MSIRYVARTDLDLTVVMWQGMVTLDEWMAHVRVMTADPKFAATRQSLTDLRPASLDASIDEAGIRKVVDVFQSHQDELENRRVAIVATKSFMKARLFEHLAQSLKTNVIVFSEIAAACTWLGVGVRETEEALAKLQK